MVLPASRSCLRFFSASPHVCCPCTTIRRLRSRCLEFLLCHELRPYSRIRHHGDGIIVAAVARRFPDAVDRVAGSSVHDNDAPEYFQLVSTGASEHGDFGFHPAASRMPGSVEAGNPRMFSVRRWASPIIGSRPPAKSSSAKMASRKTGNSGVTTG